MIKKETAKEIALNKITYDLFHKKIIAKIQVDPDELPEIKDDEIVDHEFGWLFWYQSRKYHRTQNPDDSYIGSAPLFVSKIDGTSIYIGFSLEGELSKIDEYCKLKGY